MFPLCTFPVLISTITKSSAALWPVPTQSIFKVTALDHIAFHTDAGKLPYMLRISDGHFLLLHLLLDYHIEPRITLNFGRLLSHLQEKIKSKIVFYHQKSLSTMYQSASSYSSLFALFSGPTSLIPKIPFTVPSGMPHWHQLTTCPQLPSSMFPVHHLDDIAFPWPFKGLLFSPLPSVPSASIVLGLEGGWENSVGIFIRLILHL